MGIYRVLAVTPHQIVQKTGSEGTVGRPAVGVGVLDPREGIGVAVDGRDRWRLAVDAQDVQALGRGGGLQFAVADGARHRGHSAQHLLRAVAFTADDRVPRGVLILAVVGGEGRLAAPVEDMQSEQRTGAGIGAPAYESDREVGATDLAPVAELTPVDPLYLLHSQILDRNLIVHDQGVNGEGDEVLRQLRGVARPGAVGKSDHHGRAVLGPAARLRQGFQALVAAA